MKIEKAVVIGTGMMGPGIAATLALGGVASTIASRTEPGAQKGLEQAWRQLSQLAEHQLIHVSDVPRARALLRATSSLEEAAGETDLVIESAPENMAFKQELFEKLDQWTRPDAILTSNTSGLSITAIASRCAHPERVVTTHFWNPPHLMPLVEVVRGEKSSDEVVEAVRALLAYCGKVPVVVKKDRPGQLGNRMQMALVREAVNIVQEGIADARDVDVAAKLGFGLRLPVYGVLEHQDLVGLELGRQICGYVAADLNNDPKAPALFDQKITAGETGAAAGRGFHEWPAGLANEVRARRDRFLIDCLRRGVVATASPAQGKEPRKEAVPLW
ncbi:3-hydroxyacyl-CoA dehydrogenase family protein [uncultured Paludibaculum sp.]|uniref:3-hydroxyacyl-CoA dehydrogenase family protein n=1 Tax=uncultured Paludibaculum sp. TaxID=1765020 RepID=UPI002AAC3792|nr:3-hydroxyacyl-CoA dehydrogenase family protein [uncultured Paludibaculum sp.]